MNLFSLKHVVQPSFIKSDCRGQLGATVHTSFLNAYRSVVHSRAVASLMTRRSLSSDLEWFPSSRRFNLGKVVVCRSVFFLVGGVLTFRFFHSIFQLKRSQSLALPEVNHLVLWCHRMYSSCVQ